MGLASCLGLRGWLEEPVLGGLLPRRQSGVVGGVPTLCQQCRDYFEAQISSIGHRCHRWMTAAGVMRNSIAEAQPLIRTQKVWQEAS